MDSFNAKRKCPRCRGELKALFNPSEEELKRYGNPSYWDRKILGRLYAIENISQGDDNNDFNSNIISKIIFGQHLLAQFRPVIFCEKCNYVWDLFDETEMVLSSNNQELIQTYISKIERSTTDLPNPFSIELKELHWKMSLIKARLYQHQYKNQSDSKRNDNYDYGELYRIALQNAEKLHTDNQNLLSYEYELKADMSDDTLEKFNLLNAALTSGISTHRKVRVQKNIGEIYSDVLDWWKLPISIEKPRIIFIANNLDDIAGFYDPTHSINHFFTIDRIPASIKFPYGGPTGNELYIANPVKPDEYVPYENYELALLMDKTRELKRLLRSLGATEITFTTLRGTKIEEAEKVGSSVNAEAGLLGHKVSGGYSSEDGQKRMSSQGIKVDYIERLNSNEYPSLPEGLHWYYYDRDREKQWQDIVEARLHHNQLHFEQSISTKQVSSLNEQSQMNVNAAYEGLISHINVNYHHEREFHVKTTEETMWRITAEFKPLSEFENNDNTMSHLSIGTQKNLSSDEKEYLEAVEEYLEDGMISERDRRMLERLRKSLGITEEQAVELEATLVPQLTDDEKEYIEALKECLEEGGINDRDRRTLERLRKSLDITEKRASELEAMARMY